MLNEDIFLGKVANVYLKDEDWEKLYNLFDGERYHLLVDRQEGAGTRDGYIVMELRSEPENGFRVLAVAEDVGDGALWDQMMAPDDDGDFYIPKVVNKRLLSMGEKILICEEIS